MASLTTYAVFGGFFSYLLMMILYAWQRKRDFKDYDRCKESLENRCGPLACPLFAFLTLLGVLCKLGLSLVDRCWQPTYRWMEGYFGTRSPKCWAKTKRCTAHCCAGCFYTSARAMHAIDELAESEAAKRLAKGMAPKELHERAMEVQNAYSPERLQDGIAVLEDASQYVDGWRAPFLDLRETVAKDLHRRICDELAKDSNFSQESEHFVAQASRNLGKEEGLEYGTASLFQKAGPMERVATLLTEMERTGDRLDSSKLHQVIHPALKKAAVDRLNWSMTKDGFKHIHYALLVAIMLGQHALPEAKQAGKKYAQQRQLPPDWDVIQMLRDRRYGNQMLLKKQVYGGFMGLYTLPGTLAAALQRLMDDTFKEITTRDRKTGEIPQRLVYVGARTVQNELNWAEYVQRRAQIIEGIKKKPLSPNEKTLPKTMASSAAKRLPSLMSEAQEVWLWHGTSAAGAEGITTGDFRINLAGSGAGTLYGRGIYLAEACSKSDEYTVEEGAEHYLLLCRATLGRCYYTSETKPDPNNLENICKTGQFDSVLGDREKTRGTYREFMVYDDDQVYPAYIVKYRRQYYKH